MNIARNKAAGACMLGTAGFMPMQAARVTGTFSAFINYVIFFTDW